MFENETIELGELERLYLNANWTPLLNSAYWSRDQQQYISPVSRRDPLYIVIPITVLYAAILVSGVVGNISTCIVISRNKHMHTATNYYLFSLAISDLLLLVSGLPQEMYYIWSRYYVFGEAFCVLTGFAAETSANATVLTITAFTVERYVAICHPFLSHTVSKLSRAVKFVVAIWLLALCLAVPQAIQFGVVVVRAGNSTVFEEIAQCTMKWVLLEHAFEISTLLFFVAPMTLITVLYVLIGLKLRRSRLLKRPSLSNAAERQNTKNQNRVIRMLVAVVVAFFVCWAPFHSQRLLAVYASSKADPSAAVVAVYNALTYVSGILYYLSTTVNPVLYHIMSHKFREAFKSTLAQLCGRGRKDSIHTRTYSILSRGGTHTQLVAPHRSSVSCVNAKEIPNYAQRLQRQKSAPVVPETLRLNTNPQGGIRPKQRSPIDVFAKRLRLLPKNSAAQMSIDSTNTISNSSLQDLDESEFTGSELANYMGELNNR